MYCPPTPVLNPVLPHSPLIPPAIHFVPSPPQALTLRANNPVVNNVSPLPVFFSACTTHLYRKRFCATINSYSAAKVVPASKFCPHKPRSPCSSGSKRLAFSRSLPILCIATCRYICKLRHRTTGPVKQLSFPMLLRSSLNVQEAAGSQNYVTSDFMQLNSLSSSTGTAPNFVTPLGNPHVPTLLRSSFHVQAAARSQNYVTSDLMKPSPVSSSTGTAPQNFVSPLSNSHVPTSLRSSFLVHAAAGSQNYVTSDFMQPNPVSSSTGTAPNLCYSVKQSSCP